MLETTVNHSEHARLFGPQCPNWSETTEAQRARGANYNYLFVQMTQNWANDKLQAQGHLFLNEIFDQLGLRRTRSGALVGWVLPGTEAIWIKVVEDRGEDGLVLDFNVQGTIWDKI